MYLQMLLSQNWKTLGLSILSVLVHVACMEPSKTSQGPDRENPNIIYILADDLGYGDVSFLNSQSKIQTPHMDRLASQGMVFTDAHSGSAVCTPTRYGILTGRYAWRSRLKNGVLWGYSPPLIEGGRMTVASLLQEQGYRTAGVGKWHLGLGWQTSDGIKLSDRRDEKGKTVDFTQKIDPAPTDFGFDYFFGIPASLDMDPYVYVENDHVIELPTDTIDNHEPGQEGFWRGGPIASGFKHIEVLPTLTQKAVDFIENQVKQAPEKPFFLYFPLPAPHTPVLPTEQFQGKSEAGRYGDFVMQVDDTVGQIMATVEQLNISTDTLIIVTSDNGPERYMLARKEEYNHASNHHFRGMKRDAWDGGHRIPFVASWPGKIRPGSQSQETICLTDLMATAAEIVGFSLPEDAGEDSYSILPALLGKKTDQPIREATVHHSVNGEFAIRQGNWKLILCQGSGGNNYETGPNAIQANNPPIQLYNLDEDISEQRNLWNQHPEIVGNLTHLLERYRASDHSINR